MSESGGNHERKNGLWDEGFGNPRQPTMLPTNGSLYSGHEQFNMVHPDGDTYTVLPIGNGNFIKVYHKNDESMNFSNYELFSSNNFGPQSMIKNIQPQQENYFHQSETSGMTDDSNTSMFINQLVGQNWVPNNSGTYSQFGEPQPPQQQQHPQQPPHMMPRDHFMGFASAPINSTDNYSYAPTQSNYNSPSCMSAVNSPPSINANSTSGTNGSFQHESILKKTEVKKPRMVAEVKPMRMTYSDVLSKNVSLSKTDNPTSTVPPNDGPNVQPKMKSGKNVEKSKNNSHFAVEKKGGGNSDEKESAAVKTKLNSGSVQRNDDQNGSIPAKEHKTFVDEEFNKEHKSHEGDTSKAAKKRSNGSVANSGNGNANAKAANKPKNVNVSSNDLKKRVQNNVDFEQVKVDETKNAKNSGYFYNVTKNESQSDKVNKQYQSSSRKVTNRPTTTVSSQPSRSANKTEKSSTSYQKRNHRSRQNNTYAMLAKLFEKWLEYMVKFVLWLFHLVYDVVVLSFGIIFERCHTFVDFAMQWYQILRTELKNNSGLPNAYCKKLWLKFDKKFAKESKWAFWRRIFNRKKIREPVPEYVRSGRLPSTGDEAMYSLMNCKGKDAYSILGVSSDSSQEQIRKHYKKIAVLVHPDKNKQAGAEEAFKILQRSFELIGEPENRRIYDQSLAEALNAEKAWSELNDLLTQLQSKIAEAANTIRCSSCGLRHPRRPTGRPHFAARECNSCKIRHTAREGDIWAETTMFGFCWKYLALMEGKVYDITEWANCQKGALSHLQPNSHIVQYRIVLGSQQHQQQQQNRDAAAAQQQQDKHSGEPSLDEFLDNLYSGQNPQTHSGSRRRARKN